MAFRHYVLTAILAGGIAAPFLVSSQVDDDRGFHANSSSMSSADGKSTASGEAEETKVVRYRITADSVSADASLEDGKGRITATVNGVDHELTVTTDELTWDGREVALDGFNQVELLIDGANVEILVDKRVVLTASL